MGGKPRNEFVAYLAGLEGIPCFYDISTNSDELSSQGMNYLRRRHIDNPKMTRWDVTGLFPSALFLV
jgi:hypothetical protein